MKPDLTQLLECGRRLASTLGAPIPPDGVLLEKIGWILEGRGYSEAVGAGIVTRREACNVLLAHLQTLICQHAGQREPTTTPIDERLAEEVEHARFGRAIAEPCST